jgi:hypothetical protein
MSIEKEGISMRENVDRKGGDIVWENEDDKILAVLRQSFPFGHPQFLPKLVKLAELHSAKNYDYAHGGDPLGNFTRRAKILALYPKLDMGDPLHVTLVDMLKQLDAALWVATEGYTPSVEGFTSRVNDVAVYALIASLLYDRVTAKEG